jgi:hypothetical protein
MFFLDLLVFAVCMICKIGTVVMTSVELNVVFCSLALPIVCE